MEVQFGANDEMERGGYHVENQTVRERGLQAPLLLTGGNTW